MEFDTRWNTILWLGTSLLAVSTLLTWVANKKRTYRLDTQFAVDNKCGNPRRLQYNWPLALDLLWEASRSDQAGGILNFFLAVVERTGNTFEQILLGARGIDTMDPENIEEVLSSKFNDFSLGARSENFRPLLGHGIFTQDGAAWKYSRDLLRPQFMQTRTKSFPAIQREIERFIHVVEDEAGSIIDLQPLFFRLTLDTTMAVLFGQRLEDSEASKDQDEEAFARAFDYGQHRLAVRGRLGDFYWLLAGREFRRSCKVVHEFVDSIVSKALAASASPSNIDPEEEDRYVFLQALITETKDPIVLRDQLVNILLAGRDTTACLLSWTFILLAEHQAIQDQLREECEQLPSFKLGQLPTPAEIKKMKFLSNVLSEVLRLYPSVPVNSRSALKTTTLPVGGGSDGKSPILVRKGEAVGYCVYAMHRRKDLYGEDAAYFRPSRWDSERLKNIGWGYLPFNGGPRVCPGKEFALLEASYTVIRLLQTFKKISLPTNKPKQRSHTLTLVVASKEGCRVKLS